MLAFLYTKVKKSIGKLFNNIKEGNSMMGNELDLLLHYQKKYGKRGAESWERWILRKRTINLAVMVITSVEDYDFADFELALYFRCDDEQARFFMRIYESQMEEAMLQPERFIKNLDMFYMETCKYIEKEQLYRGFYNFCDLLNYQRNMKIAQGHRAVFDAYVSLLMQQTCYFCRDRLEDNVVGITDDGNLIFRKNPHPYSDLGSYRLEKQMYLMITGGKELTEEQIHDAYKMYGYDIYSLTDVEHLEAIAKVHDSNVFVMAPYISEREVDITLRIPYQQYMPEFPRRWKTTDFYMEKLSHRNYMLPATGITAQFINAGDIQRIYFTEIFRDEEIVLLYRVSTNHNGEYSGFYHTKSKAFYSIYEHTNCPEWHENVKNFILENYMILTCDYEIDRKKNYAIRQVEDFKNEFHFPYQPLAVYNYIKKEMPDNKTKTRSRECKYNKAEYYEEVRTRSGYIRRLPQNQHASEDAVQYAAQLGLELPSGKTFVRSHEFRVHQKIYMEAAL